MLKKHILKYVFSYNRWIYLAICAMLLIMSVLFFSLNSMNSRLASIQQQFEVDYMQEDFHFYPHLTSSSITQKTAELEQKYNISIEKQGYKLAKEGEKSYKIVRQTAIINKPYMLNGTIAISPNDVVIDNRSAEYLGLEIGNPILLNNQKYVISGVAAYPGQVQPNMSLSGYKMYNVQDSMLISFANEIYEQLDYAEKVIYSGVWLGDMQKLDSNDFIFLQVKADNQEINALQSKHMMNQMIAGLSTGVLATIVMLMLFMLLYKMVKDNEQSFGILKAIGYTNRQLIYAFIPFLITFSIPILLGYAISTSFQQSLFKFMNQDLIVPYLNTAQEWKTVAAVVIVFLVGITFTATIHLNILLKKSPIKMIQGTTQAKLNKLSRMILNLFNGLKGLRKLQFKFIISHSFVLVLTLFTGFAIGVQLLLSFAMYEVPNKLVAGYKDQTHYQYDIKFSKPIELPDNEAVVGYNVRTGSFNYQDSNNALDFVILHEPQKQNLLQLKMYKDGANINGLLNHGVVISKWFSNKYDLAYGDSISFEKDGKVYEVVVSAVHQGLQGTEVYTSKSYYEKMTSEALVAVDGIYSADDTWSLLIDEVSSIVNQQDIISSASNSVEKYKLISVFLLAIGMLIGVIIFTIALYIVIQNSQKQILLLKAMGYTNKQVYTITIEGYLIVLLFGFVTAKPYLSMLTILLFNMLSKVNTFYLPINNTVIQMTCLVLLLIVFFYVISLFYARKISQSKNYMSLRNE